MESKNEAFTKYRDKGAYHWRKVFGRSFSPQLRARYDISAKFLSKELNIQGKLGIDMGCGDGVLIYKLKKLGRETIGIDLSIDGLSLARNELTERRVNPLRLINASCYHIPIRDGAVDYIISTELIEHLTDPPKFISEIKRVLKPDGILILTTPHKMQNKTLHDPFHVYEYTAEDLSNFLKQYFENVRLYGCCPYTLNRLYDGISIKWVRKFMKFAFRMFTSLIINPYEYLITSNPDSKWDQLIAVCKNE